MRKQICNSSLRLRQQSARKGWPQQERLILEAMLPPRLFQLQGAPGGPWLALPSSVSPPPSRLLSLCVSIFPPYKDTRHLGLGATLMTSS